MGERSGAQLRWFTDFYEEKSGLWFEGVNASAVCEKVRAPPPSPGVLYRVTVSGGLGLRRTDHRDGCLKKADYLSVQVLIKDG